jgi:hypothetical protein
MAISLPIVSEWNPAGLNKAIADFKKLETAGEKAQFAIKKAAVPAGLAIAGLGVVAVDAVKAFAEDDAAAQKLATTLQNVTNATDAQVNAVEDFITKTSIAAAVSDDELRPAFDSLVRGTGDVAQAQDLLGLALDISAGTGKDLATVSDALSKAYNGNFKALKTLDPALAGLIAEGADADTVFGRLAGTFQNQASKQANTTQGKFKSMSIALGETKEAIGAALIPILNKLLPKLQSLGNFVRDNTGLIVTIGVVIGTLAAAILAANAAIAIYNTIQAVTLALNTALTASFSALWVATGAVIILGIVAALIALQAKFDIFGKTIGFLKEAFNIWWQTVKTIFGLIRGTAVAVFTAVGGAVSSWYTRVRGYIDAVYGAFKTVFNAVASIWNNTIGKLSFKVPSWVPVIGGKGFDVPDIPMLADGGIVTGPTLAMIGERGPEAVIPLNRAGAMGNTNITVNMPAGSNGDDVVRALQQWSRRNGALPLTTTTQIRR